MTPWGSSKRGMKAVADKKKEKPKAEDEEKKEDDAPAAEGEGGEGAPAEAPKKKFPLKIVLIIVGVLVLVGAIVGGLFAFGVIGGKKHPAATDDAAASDSATPGGEGKAAEAEKKEDKKEKAGKSVFYDLGEIMVNISGDGRRQTYLRLVVQLELESEADKAAIENLKPRIIDNFQTYLRELRLDDLRGSAGLYRLREELLFRVADAVHPIKVKDVLFQQMLVQ